MESPLCLVLTLVFPPKIHIDRREGEIDPFENRYSWYTCRMSNFERNFEDVSQGLKLNQKM